MTPVEALERVVHCLDRAHETGFKTKAYVRALEVVRATPPDELSARSEAGTLTELEGIGDSTARLITQALNGDNSYVEKIEAETGVKLTDDGARYRAALKGDCHLHSLWSDGGATIEAMTHFVAFARGEKTGARIGFHTIPVLTNGEYVQPLESVGTDERFGDSSGCIRVLPDQGPIIWDWLQKGDGVRVLT